MKKTIFLIIAMTFGVMQANAHEYAYENSDGVVIYYNTDSDMDGWQYYVVTFRGNSYSTFDNEYSGVVNIPSVVHTKMGGDIYVRRIANNAFRDCPGLTGVTIPGTVEIVGENAFYKCSGLTSLSIANGVKNIGSSAFWGCAGLTNLTIPESVNKIGSQAFSRCDNLKSVTLNSNGVASYVGSAFMYCYALQEYIVSANNPMWTAIDGVLFNKDQTALIAYPNAKSSTYAVPSHCTALNHYAFAGCRDLTEVILPNNLTFIGSSAFDGCKSLTSITIPDNVTSVEEDAFYNCMELKVITVGKGVSKIANYAFAGCRSAKEIRLRNPVPVDINSVVFSNISTSEFPDGYSVDKSSCRLYVPKGSLNAYKTADVWKDFVNIIEEDFVGIESMQGKQNVSAYYASGHIILSGLQGSETLRLYNINGNLLFSRQASSEMENIPVEHLPAGVYFVRTSDGQTLKWVKK